MIQCRAWVGPCDTNIGGVTPGVPVEGTETVTLLKALTRVLWRELLMARKVRIIVEWDQEPGLANIEIQSADGDLLIAHTVHSDEESYLAADMWPEIRFHAAEPSTEWLTYLVDGWLTSGDAELLDAGSQFPGVDSDAWDDLTDDEALTVARGAMERLSKAIEKGDREALAEWAEAAPINGGSYTHAAVEPWMDSMTWSGLPPAQKDKIRGILRYLEETVDESGCDGLLRLTELAG